MVESSVVKWASRSPASSGFNPSPGALNDFFWTASPSSLNSPFSSATNSAR